jgi:hypothetical protein
LYIANALIPAQIYPPAWLTSLELSPGANAVDEFEGTTFSVASLSAALSRAAVYCKMLAGYYAATQVGHTLNAKFNTNATASPTHTIIGPIILSRSRPLRWRMSLSRVSYM